MSSIIHKKVYREFLKLLEEFQKQLNSSDKPISQEVWSDYNNFRNKNFSP